jgi:hypothetical protein
MSTYAWKMKADSSPDQNTLKFEIIDNHHTQNFYGSWEAKNQKELEYHMDGVEECVRRGSYKNNVFELNGKKIDSFTDFNLKLREYFAA